jgi:hypothetical protein
MNNYNVYPTAFYHPNLQVRELLFNNQLVNLVVHH